MTPKKVKEYLMQYTHAKRRENALSDHIAELRAMCEQLRTEDGHRIALDAAVAELVDTEQKVSAEVTQLCRIEVEIDCIISRMPEPYHTLLLERYINGKTWEQIADRMHYSRRGVTKMHGRALQIIAKSSLKFPLDL